jgi:hypothetical protein
LPNYLSPVPPAHIQVVVAGGRGQNAEGDGTDWHRLPLALCRSMFNPGRAPCPAVCAPLCLEPPGPHCVWQTQRFCRAVLQAPITAAPPNATSGKVQGQRVQRPSRTDGSHPSNQREPSRGRDRARSNERANERTKNPKNAVLLAATSSCASITPVPIRLLSSGPKLYVEFF